MPTFDELSAPGSDPSLTIGASSQSRYDQIDRPLRDAQRLLMQAAAQDALVQGDALLPVLALLVMSDSWRCDNAALQKAAEEVLISHPFLRHDAARFLVALNLHHTDQEQDRIVAQAFSLLKPEVQEALRPAAIPLVSETSTADLHERYRTLVGQPLKAMPGWALLGARLPDDWSMRYLVAGVDRAGYKSWGETVYALDLKVTTPITYEHEEAAPAIPDDRLGSPAIVTWWHEVGKQKGTKALWAKNVRLPSDCDARSGGLLTTGVSDAIAEARAAVREARAEFAAVYSPESRSDGGQQLLREAWFRTLCDAAGARGHVSYPRQPGRTAGDTPSGDEANRR